MKSANQIAFLNLLFIVINCFWILILDEKKVFGNSIYETFSSNWSYLTPHLTTFNIWKIIAIVMVLTAVFYCMTLSNEKEDNKELASQVQKSGNLMIANQLFLGISMVLKLNGYLVLAYLCSIATIVSLTKLNKIFNINNHTNLSYIHLFTRISLGIYTGWLVYLLGFNGLPTLNKLLRIPNDHSLFFYLALVFLVCSFIYILCMTMKSKLSAILIGYAVGVIGTYYQIIHNPNGTIYTTIIKNTLVGILIIAFISVIYIVIVRRNYVLKYDQSN